MNYLISFFDCFVLADNFPILKNVKYEFEFSKNQVDILCSNSTLVPFFQFNKNIQKVKYKFDTYYFLIGENNTNTSIVSLNVNSKQITIQRSGELKIFVDGKVVCDEMVNDMEFSHYEKEGDILFIYFSGERNFVVVMKEFKLCFAGYYDECNIAEGEKYFLLRLRDCLNHGRVCHISKNQVETFLVYLDDYELNMKYEFVASVFLDCVIAGNYKYANSVLKKEIQLKKEGDFNSFFPCFDKYYLIEDNVAVLFHKNQNVGVVEFEVCNLEISNIILV